MFNTDMVRTNLHHGASTELLSCDKSQYANKCSRNVVSLQKTNQFFD